MSALCFSTGQRDPKGLRSPPWGLTKHQSYFRLQEFTSPPDGEPQHLPAMLPSLFSTTDPEEKERSGAQRAFQPQARPRKSSPKLFPPQTRPWHGGRGGARPPAGARAAEHTHWAEPTLLSLFPSPLAALASSTSCCSSVIGAASGGHLQTAARLRPASGSSSRGGRPRGRRPSAPPRASPAPAAPRASRPGPGRRPPTWTRSSGRDWSERAGKSREGGKGRAEAKDSLLPHPRGGGRGKGNLLN